MEKIVFSGHKVKVNDIEYNVKKLDSDLNAYSVGDLVYCCAPNGNLNDLYLEQAVILNNNNKYFPSNIYTNNILLNSHINPIYIPDYSDFNDYKTAGFYYNSADNAVQNISNMPMTSSKYAFTLEVRPLGNMRRQVYTSYNNFYYCMRTYYDWSDIWSSWTRVYTSQWSG